VELLVLPRRSVAAIVAFRGPGAALAKDVVMVNTGSGTAPLTEDSTSRLPAGTILGNHRLEGLLQCGSMGSVYRATQLTLMRPVALKILKQDRAGEFMALDAFLGEARRSANLSHPRLVTVIDVAIDEQRSLCYYTMPLIQGRTLATLVQQEGPLSPSRALSILLQCADGMAYAHGRGLVHRDLAPRNILVESGDQVRIIDLGLALDRFAKRTETGRKTLRLVGTVEYCAPEQLRNPDRATPASDVFSLGCVLAFMLQNRPPFDGESLLDMVCAIAADAPRLPPVSAGLQALLERMLVKNPLERFADAGVLHQAIMKLLVPNTPKATKSTGTGSFRKPPRVAQPIAPARRRRR
jgi:serine/threonine-protein kinase